MTHHLQGAWVNDAPVPPGCREKGIRTCGAKCLSPRALALKERGSLSLAALGGDSSGDMGSNAEPTGWAGWILGAEPGALGAGWPPAEVRHSAQHHVQLEPGSQRFPGLID